MTVSIALIVNARVIALFWQYRASNDFGIFLFVWISAISLGMIIPVVWVLIWAG
jgi:hypothetical protein